MRTIDKLHRLVSLGHLLQHSAIVGFAIQRFLQASQCGCRVSLVAQLNAFAQQLFDKRWRRRRGSRGLSRCRRRRLQGSSWRRSEWNSDGYLLCREAGSASPTDIVGGGEKDLSHSKNHGEAESKMEAGIDPDSA